MAEQTKIRAGVIGWPISHSLSPRVHGFWLNEHGIDGSYEAFAVKPEDISQSLRRLSEDGFAGVNLTVPHKEVALECVDHVGANAQRIGAVNTIVVQTDGTLQGTNTDGFGFLENIKSGAPDYQPAQGPAVIIGAGGAARAIVVALINAGAPEIKLVNRTRERAQTLSDQIGGPITVAAWDERATILSEATLLVNTTTLGMANQPPLDLNLSALPPSALVTDIVYAPLETELLKTARLRGNQTVDGLGMLLHQARPGFESWFGVRPEVSPALREHVLAGIIS
jgi:shikimate dehydrogenase